MLPEKVDRCSESHDQDRYCGNLPPLPAVCLMGRRHVQARSALTPPHLEFRLVGVDGTTLLVVMAMNRQTFFSLPPVKSAYFPLQVGSYLFRGIQAIVWRHFSRHGNLGRIEVAHRRGTNSWSCRLGIVSLSEWAFSEFATCDIRLPSGFVTCSPTPSFLTFGPREPHSWRR